MGLYLLWKPTKISTFMPFTSSSGTDRSSISPYSLQVRGKADQKNFEYGEFLRCATFSDILLQKRAVTGDLMVASQAKMRKDEWVQGVET